MPWPSAPVPAADTPRAQSRLAALHARFAEAHRATVTDATFAFDSSEAVIAAVAWRAAQPGETWSDVSLALPWADGGIRWSADGGPWQVAVYAQRPAGALGYNIETGGAVA